MARGAALDGWSRFVRLAKIMLPVLSLALLSVLFLLSRDHGTVPTIPYSDAEIDALAREQRLRAPDFAGVTQDGDAIRITAEEGRPDPREPSVVTAAGLSVTLQGTARDVALDAAVGRIDPASGTFSLGGGLTVRTSDGYDLDADGLDGRLDLTAMRSTGPVDGAGPLGDLSAGLLTLDAEGLTFDDGVALVYRPPT
ncbi:lipopolysaccharide export system protein LptC [Hasllibacter halocynthiae]|uniref:Lipopolysaccharide export system protein LptC n=1 Tax=Hasllibacter halocynthiae TaxID=595589 RepID=A0A2T0X221_9RHOB|nr:hypothetical protein [Hasllibacter halocynthiae]PRY93003.1 lipopolysaccharide export system protein LptC [Hasllibacter halocynthiae]